jgi:hypothetical protein
MRFALRQILRHGDLQMEQVPDLTLQRPLVHVSHRIPHAVVET